MKLWFLTNDLEIGYIKHLCDCNECKLRGKYEYYLVDEEDCFLDSLTYESLLKKVLVFDYSLQNIKYNKMMAMENVKINFVKNWNECL